MKLKTRDMNNKSSKEFKGLSCLSMYSNQNENVLS